MNFEDFIGSSGAEDDNGWSREVWDAAQAAILNKCVRLELKSGPTGRRVLLELADTGPFVPVPKDWIEL